MLKKLKSIIPLLVFLNSSNVLSQEIELKYNIDNTLIQEIIFPIKATLKISEGNPHTRIDGISGGKIRFIPKIFYKDESFAIVDSAGYPAVLDSTGIPIDFLRESSTIWNEGREYKVEHHNLMSALWDLINRDLNEDLIYYKIKKGNSEYIVEFKMLGNEKIPIDDKLLDATLLEGSVIATFNEDKDKVNYKGTVDVIKEKPHYLLKGSLESSKYGHFEGEIDSKSYERLESILKKADASSSKKPIFPITIRE